MNPIDPGQRLAAALGQPLAARESHRSRTEAGRRPGAAAATAAPLSAVLAQQVQALAPDDPDRPRKAARLFLAAELARTFGRTLLNGGFPTLLDALQQQMEQDPQTAAAVDALGRLLVAGRGAPD